jgi:hypothetical protein
MLDSNMAMDRNKIAYIAGLPRGEEVINAALDETRPLTLESLAHRFGVADMILHEKSAGAMAALLYFFGVLTIEGTTLTGKLILRVPNLVTRKLYLEELERALIPSVGVRDSVSPIIEDFLLSGDIAPLCAFVEENIFGALDNRDYRWANEFSVKITFLALLYNDILYIADSEPALQRSYADLLLLLRPDRRTPPLFDILFEFKYISLKEAGISAEEARAADPETLRALPPAAAKLTEARRQLERYRQTLLEIYGDALNLRCYALVAVGFERLASYECRPEGF